jgi:hypothetical protein
VLARQRRQAEILRRRREQGERRAHAQQAFAAGGRPFPAETITPEMIKAFEGLQKNVGASLQIMLQTRQAFAQIHARNQQQGAALDGVRQEGQNNLNRGQGQ